MNDDKHNPLSPDELYKLLDKKTNKDLNELDEFEQEALEGLAMLENPEKAKKVIEEINVSISKKISGQEDKGTQKNRIIWFSAAASLVLIIMISVFFLRQAKHDSGSELALSEANKKEQMVSPDNRISDAAVPAEPVNTAVKEKELLALPKGAKSLEKKDAVTTTMVENKPALAEKAPVSVTGKEAKDEQMSGEQKNRSDNDGNFSSSIVIADQPEVSKKAEAAKEENEVGQGYSIAQNTSKNQTQADETKELRKEDSRNADKAYKNKSNEVAAASVPSTKITAAPAMSSNNNESAYYPGGEPAIKAFVLDYVKSKQYSNVITGTYKIKGSVSATGSLKVNSIIQTNRDNCNCTDKIKEALNTMTKWNSLSYDGKKTSTDVEFEVKF